MQRKLNQHAERYLHSMVTTTLLTMAKVYNQPKCPSADEWIKKNFNVIYIHISHTHTQIVYYTYILYTYVIYNI
jgi:hypothetical protein